MNICVFCSAAEVPDVYIKDAEDFARLLAEGGHTLVWGGSDKGLMKVMASGVQARGGKIVGISVEHLKESARKDADEMIIAKSLGERKAALLERADAVVALVGGLGTLDELTEVLELRKHQLHDKLIVVLNTNGFYDGFKMQLARIEQEGFHMSAKFPRALTELICFADTPAEAMRYIENHVD